MKPTVYLDATIPSFGLNAQRRLVSPLLVTPAQLLELNP